MVLIVRRFGSLSEISDRHNDLNHPDDLNDLNLTNDPNHFLTILIFDQSAFLL